MDGHIMQRHQRLTGLDIGQVEALVVNRIQVPAGQFADHVGDGYVEIADTVGIAFAQ